MRWRLAKKLLRRRKGREVVGGCSMQPWVLKAKFPNHATISWRHTNKHDRFYGRCFLCMLSGVCTKIPEPPNADEFDLPEFKERLIDEMANSKEIPEIARTVLDLWGRGTFRLW